MHALIRAPGVDVRHRAAGRLTPLSFTAAVVATVEEPEDEGEADEAEEEDAEHHYPFVVGGYPGNGKPLVLTELGVGFAMWGAYHDP